MKVYFGTILLLAVICTTCSALATPKPENALIATRQQIDLFGSSRRLIEQLVENLRKAAREAVDAIGTFTSGIQQEAKIIRERIANDIQKLRERVSQTIENVSNRLIDSGVSVLDCVLAHRGDANALFNQTLEKTMKCVDTRINEVGEQISGLRTMANEAVEFANQAIQDMRVCTEQNDGFLNTGSCLGAVAVQTEMKAIVFATQSGISIARINLSLATLPASLEVCAGTRLVETGLSTARIVMDIGTCSASSVFTAMTGDVQMQIDSNHDFSP